MIVIEPVFINGTKHIRVRSNVPGNKVSKNGEILEVTIDRDGEQEFYTEVEGDTPEGILDIILGGAE